MHRGAECVQVRAELDLAAILLGRRVALRADHRGVAQRLEQARDAEIDQLDLPRRRQHHVRRLEVAIDHRRFKVVQVFERVENLQGHVDNLALGKLAAGAFELLFESDSLDKFHHEIVMVLVAEAIEHARDMFVAELREHVGLALERGHRLLLRVRAGETIDHLGQRARPRSQSQVFGEIDEFHPASTERLHHTVAAADDSIGRNHAFSQNLTITSTLWLPGGLRFSSRHHVLPKRSRKGCVGGAYHMNQDAERRSHTVRQGYAEKPQDSSPGFASIDVADTRDDAQDEREHRAEAGIFAQQRESGYRRAARFAEARLGDDDRLPASRAKPRLLELCFRHGK